MDTISIAGWSVTVDVDRTRETFSTIDKGGWQICSCDACRNFGAVALTTFPGEFLAFLESAGIPCLKPAEVYEFGEVRPGVHSYGGEYYFWGTINHSGFGELSEFPKFSVNFASPSPLAQSQFKHGGSICVLFSGELPWRVASNAP